MEITYSISRLLKVAFELRKNDSKLKGTLER